jgi:cation diffusion facilitator family transporter
MAATPLPPVDVAALSRRVTMLSVAAASLLVAIKAWAWAASGSLALLASLTDSGLDLLASLATFFAVRYAAAPPDAEHRYGHGKAEAFASLFQAGLVFASAALIGEEAIRHLIAPQPIEAGGWAMAVMVVSIAVTAGVVAAQTHVLRRTSSVAVSGDRAHYAVDLASNLAALVGIAGAAWLDLPALDGIAALIVAGLLLWGAIGVFRQASDQLLDHEIDPDDRAAAVAAVLEDPRISNVHQMRTRASGPYLHMQMHLELDPRLTLEAAHHVIVAAEGRVLARFPTADILMHADPRGRAEPHGGLFGEQAAAEDDLVLDKQAPDRL